MAVSVEVLEGLQRKIILSLNWDSINSDVTSRLKVQQRKTRVDGFRRGKVPMKMVQSMYGNELMNEAINQQAFNEFNRIANEDQIKLVSLLKLEPVEQEETNEPQDSLKIAAVFEVYPEINIGDLSAQEIEKINTQVNDSDIEKTIDILRQQRTVYNYVERAAQEGDRVIVDFAGKIDGEVFAGGEGQNHPFIIGRKEMLPEFENGVIGLKEGEKKDVSVSFPEDYHGKDVAGKTAIFTIEVKNVAEAKLPELDAEFARSLGIADGDVEKMRAEIQKNISREVKRRTGEMTKGNAMKALLAVTPIDVPSALLQDESERLRSEMLERFQNQGMDAKMLTNQLPLNLFEERARERVALGLILAQLVEDQKLQASDEQIREVIAGFADSYEDPQEVIDWYLSNPENMRTPTALATEENVVSYLLKQAKVLEKEMTFDEVMAQQS